MAEPGSLPQGFVFSQGSLQDYLDCPRRFELQHLLRIAWPVPPGEPALEVEEHMRRGVAFHRLVHQAQLGVPAEAMERGIDDPDLLLWWRAYAEFPPALPASRYAEVALSAPLNCRRLIARMDLVAALPGERLIVVDWKTNTRVPSRSRLEERMQTRVYRYLLAVAGAEFADGEPVAPEQVEMLYWFAQEPAVPIVFRYSAAQLSDDEVYLAALAAEIGESAQERRFPLTDDPKHCRFCRYATLCERNSVRPRVEDLEDHAEDVLAGLDLEQVIEVEF
jgi:hypothetical protein